MNKAFVREPDFDGQAYCPRCGGLGVPVGEPTLDFQLPGELRRRLGDSAWFCEFPRCDVVYFDLFETTVVTDEFEHPVYPKDAAAPICACFGFSWDELDADLEEGTPTRIRALLEKSKSPAADCQRRACDGRCCMREIQRLYMKRLSGGGGST